MKQTIVFAGPTISSEAIQKILPHACVHAPIQCGDICKLLRLKPERLIIIDGYYEITASVWHKEILLALAQGVEVVGAASMGALRAAELSVFGMIGKGKIYQWYQDKTLTDDDEVAVLHLDEQQSYRSQSEALVNIRATLTQALEESVITPLEHDALLAEAKSLFYPQRQYPLIIAKVEQKGGNLDVFKSWLPSNIIDLKQQDAQLTLEWAKYAPIASIPFFPLSDTIYLKRLILTHNSSAFLHAYPWLPDDEKTTIYLAQQQEALLPLLRELAIMLNLIHSLRLPSSGKNTLEWLAAQKDELNLSASVLTQASSVLAMLFLNSEYIVTKAEQPLLNSMTLAFFILDQQGTDIKCRLAEQKQYRKWVLGQVLHLNESSLGQYLEQKQIEPTFFDSFIAKIARYRLCYTYFIGLPMQVLPTIPLQNWLLSALELI